MKFFGLLIFKEYDRSHKDRDPVILVIDRSIKLHYSCLGCTKLSLEEIYPGLIR